MYYQFHLVIYEHLKKLVKFFLVVERCLMLFRLWHIHSRSRIERNKVELTAVLVAVATLLGIGELTAQKDEGNLSLAFDKKDLRNGCPILIYKKHIKKKGVIVREFYTTIPMKKWVDRKESIEDVMNLTCLTDFEYGENTNDNGNKIIIKSSKGRKPKDRGILYDENF